MVHVMTFLGAGSEIRALDSMFLFVKNYDVPELTRQMTNAKEATTIMGFMMGPSRTSDSQTTLHARLFLSHLTA